MLRLETIFCLLAVVIAASVSNTQAVQSDHGDNLETEQQRLGLLRRFPRSSRHHHQHGRSSSKDYSHDHDSNHKSSVHHSGRGMGVASGRGNIFNWEIDASSGKNKKKTPQRLETDDVSLENNK